MNIVNKTELLRQNIDRVDKAPATGFAAPPKTRPLQISADFETALSAKAHNYGQRPTNNRQFSP